MTDTSHPGALRADLDKQPDEVASMFDHVAPRYDLMNTALSLGQVHLWRRAVSRALGASPGERVLDLAAGTGTSTAQLAGPGVHLVACDLSEGMIEVGRRAHPELEFVRGDALDLPFGSDSFDAVTISFGLRNVHDTAAALTEMARVTKPGGRLVICEFSTPVNPAFRRLYRWYLRTALPRLAGAASSDPQAYGYLTESIADWPDQETLGRVLAGSGWRAVSYRNLSGGIVALHRAIARG